jgi:Sel1 repeat
MSAAMVEKVTQDIRVMLSKAHELRLAGKEDEGRKQVETAAATFQSFIANEGDPLDIVGFIWDVMRIYGYEEAEIEKKLSTPETPASVWKKKGKIKKIDLTGLKPGGQPHNVNPRGSTKDDHEEGERKRKMSFGGEKGDANRPYPRKRPANWPGGPWPPRHTSIDPNDQNQSKPQDQNAQEQETGGQNMEGQQQLNEVLLLVRKAEQTNGPYPLTQLQKVADTGYAPAIYALATWYLHGREVKKDHIEAAKLLKKATDAGFPPAERDLAICYELGSGVKEDHKQAFEYYLRAANNSDLEAQGEVARCYYYGIGTEEDKPAAAKWYQIAAKRGNADAQFALGRMLELGEGGKANPEQAIQWYERAAAQGHEDAKKVIEETDQE